MNVRELLTELIQKDIKLVVEGNILTIDAPKNTLTREVQEKLKIYKKDIIEILTINSATKEQPPVKQVQRDGPVPLSLTQRGLWFINQFEGGTDTQYNIPWLFRLKGRLNVRALQQAFNTVITRHQSLRTTFHHIDGEAVQVIADRLTLDIPVIEVAEAWVSNYIEEHACHVFDLATGPLIKVTILRLLPNEHILLTNLHHIISDGWSMGVLTRELSALYEAVVKGEDSPLVPLPIQYADFSHWQRQWLQGEILEQKISYWKNHLEGAPALLELPTDRPRPAQQSFRGASETFLIPKQLTDQLNSLSRRENATLFVTLMAAFKVLLYRYTRQRDICVGTPFANRQRQELEGLIGFFLNTIVFRSQMNPELPFRNLLQQINKHTLAAHDYQDVPFEFLVEVLKPERSISYAPLFQVMFVLQNAAEESLELLDITSTPIEIDRQTAKYDLTMDLTETPEGLEGVLEYNTDLFDQSTIKRLVTHYQVLLESIVSHPDQTLAALPFLSDEERQQILINWNNTKADFQKDKCIHQLFEAQVGLTPNATAVIFDGQQLTYQELNKKSNQLANYLIERGVVPEVRVGLCVDRSLEMVIGMLGILKAGGTYVPIDPEYPQQRIEYLLADSDIVLLLTQEDLSNTIFAQRAVPCFCLDRDWPMIRNYLQSNPGINVFLLNSAYVIYTSGSTGKPKGVAVPHNGLLKLCDWHQHAFDVNTSSKATQLAGIGFDAMAWETWPYLTVGAQLFLVRRDLVLMPQQLIEWISAKGITHCFMPTSLLEKLLTETWPKNCHLKFLLTGGDKLNRLPPPGLPFELVNNYGPTEATAISTSGIVNPQALSTPSIGRPISNTNLYILDNTLNPVPVGVVGELYIGGAGLAHGYLGRPGLTAEKFIPDPYSDMPGERLYRSGDLVRYLSDGNIDFIGRIDYQVKVRGFRIELGEIESVLTELSEVREAVVLAWSGGETTGDKCLTAYIVLGDDIDRDQEFFRQVLKGTLPNYMIPTFFIFLDELPLTPNGKIDRKALPEPDTRALQTQKYVAPRTEVEQGLVSIWAEILKLPTDKIGIHDNFFDLGGHSLLATRVVSHVRKTFNTEIQIRDLFSATSVHDLALIVNEEITKQSLSDDKTLPLVSIERTGFIPLSFAQQRLWFINQYEEGGDFSYNMPWALRLTGKLNIKALKNTFNTIIERHESLRTTFRMVDGEAIQSIADELLLDIPIVDVTDTEIAAHINANVTHIFDLEKGPLIKVNLLRLSAEEDVLLLNLHHIISDGWSMGVLNYELTTLYTAYAKGGQSPLPPLPIQYADFSQWQRQRLQGDVLEQHVCYWKNQLKEAPALLELPTGQPRPPVLSYRGSYVAFNFSAGLTQQLQQLGRQENATLFMVLMTAFKILIYRYTGQTDICVGTSIANRQRQELENLIGFFVNALVLRDQINKQQSFKSLLRQVKETALSAYAHQDMPFEYLVNTLEPERSLSHMPLIQILLVLQNAPQQRWELPGVTLSTMASKMRTAKFDLTLFLTESPEGLLGHLEYSTDLFQQTTIERLITHFQTLLEGIVKNPNQCLATLPMLTEPERQQLLGEYNDASTDAYYHYPQDKCMHQLFEAQAELTPNAVAVVYEDQQLTYKELNRRSNQLAHYLTEQGIGPEIKVGLCLERSLELVIGILGILKAGGAYVPIDANNPQKRTAYLLADSDVSLLLTQSDLLASIFKEPNFKKREIPCLCLDKEGETLAQYSVENPNTSVDPGNLAYIIYTSGSTGNPKGVLVTHENVGRLFAASQDLYQFNRDDVWTLFHSYAFDFSVWEIWGALIYGGKLVVVPYWVSRAAEEFYQLVCNAGVTILNQTPSAFKQFIEADKALGGPKLSGQAKQLALRYVIFGGEALEMKSLRPWFERHGDQQPQLINMYGITETTVHVTYHPINRTMLQDSGSVIGKPLADLQAYILDDYQQLVPVGVPGELYVGGGGVARGYHDRPELTEQRFIPNPFSPKPVSPNPVNKSPNTHLYKTGDLVRRLADGNMEYLGRIDQQVKIRGFRIELGEIEASLGEHAAVREAVVLAREDSPGEKQLVAYLVPDQDYQLPVQEVTELSIEAVAQWQDVFDTTYTATMPQNDPFYDFIGWNSSYTGNPIPEVEMREWADTTVERLLALKPKRVLEIACGTGILLGSLVPHCDAYTGVDFSSQVLNRLQGKLPQLGEHAKKVTLLQGRADDLSELAGQSFDTIIFNSVVQYFPDIDYLIAALIEALQLLTPGGQVFVGDVRHLGLQGAFHASVQLHGTQDDSQSISDFSHLVQSRIADDGEVVVAPTFFRALQAQSPVITHVQVMPKICAYHNEMSNFRYDVVLRSDQHLALLDAIPWSAWQDNSSQNKRLGVEQIQDCLSNKQPDLLALTGITNARVFNAREILRQCNQGNESIETVADLKDKLETLDNVGLDPHALKQVADAMDYCVEFNWAEDDPDGAFEVVFHKCDEDKQVIPLIVFPNRFADEKNPSTNTTFQAPSLQTSSFQESFQASSLRAFANNPRLKDLRHALVPILRDHLGSILPEHMVPSFFVFLNNLPLTANGKVDYKALPAPNAGMLQTRDYVAPSTETEQQLVATWASVLNIPEEKIGIDHDFFELGGNSISVMKTIGLCRKRGLHLTAKDIFEQRTIQALAALRSNALQGLQEEIVVLENEIKLDDAISVGDLPLAQFNAPQSILLTGATGFVGAHLLKELIERTDAWIYCLVKAESSVQAAKRLKQNLNKYGLYDKNEFSRIIPLPGDLSLPLLGLPSSGFDELTEAIDLIYHNGAWVNHVLPYDSLKAANVGGTHEILKLATRNKLKPVHYISTSAAAYTRDEDFNQHLSVPQFGYTLSKYVAEKLVYVAQDRGIPVSIYRLGMIAGHSVTGVSNTTNRVCQLIKGCIELNCAPNAEGLAALLPSALTPVDYLARFITTLSQREDSIGQTYNTDSPQLIQWDALLTAFQQFGYNIQTLPLESWRSKLSDRAIRFPNQIYDTLLGLYDKELYDLFDHTRDPDGKSQALPADAGLNYCVVDGTTIKQYLTYFIDSGFVKAPEDELVMSAVVD